jgi:hypothetical protein
MRESAAEQLRRAKAGEKEQVTVQLDILGLATRMLGDKPEPTQWEFICDPAEEKLYMGRAGAAKTSTLMCAMLLRALLQPGFKGVILRQHYNSMFNTVIERAEEMLGRLSPDLLLDRNKTPPMRWLIRSAIDDSISTILFSGINELPKGFGCHAICVDEVDELEEKDANALRMRNRLQDGARVIMFACNPPDTTHWLYTAATGKNHEEREVSEPWLKMFVPKDGENASHLPSDYYEKAAKGMPEDLRQRFIHGAWGSVFPNAPVYREFAGHIHVKDNIQYNQHWPVLRLRDFGYRRPACIFAQLDESNGCMDCLYEMLGENEEVNAFEDRVQAISNQKYRGAAFIDFGDPAVDQHKDTGNTLELLSNRGVHVNFMHSELEEGIRTVRLLLEKLSHGRALFQFDRKGCPILIRALRGGYGMDKHGRKPVKDGYYDHLADAFRYGVINVYDSSGGIKVLPQTSNFYGAYARPNSNIPDSVEYDPNYDNGVITQ